MFRRSNSHSNNFAAAGSAVNAAAIAATVPRVHVTRYGAREVARFQLPMAPRHVIPPKHKKDILTKAFRFHKNDGEEPCIFDYILQMKHSMDLASSIIST